MASVHQAAFLHDRATGNGRVVSLAALSPPCDDPAAAARRDFSQLGIWAGSRLPLSHVTSPALGSRVEMDAAQGIFQCYQHSTVSKTHK